MSPDIARHGTRLTVPMVREWGRLSTFANARGVESLNLAGTRCRRTPHMPRVTAEIVRLRCRSGRGSKIVRIISTRCRNHNVFPGKRQDRIGILQPRQMAMFESLERVSGAVR